MAWKDTCAVDERLRFVLAAEAGEETMSLLCREFGVSRKTGYKWLERYRAEGPVGLVDRSRAPHSHPLAVPARLAEDCLAVRRAHPTWGPQKVQAYLRRRRPREAWPAASTIGALFDAGGLTVHRRRRQKAPPRTAPFAACAAANDVWCIDFKGWFVTGDGQRCDPLTLSDAYSRYLLRCQAVEHGDEVHVWPILDAALREYGLPRAMRSDNGPPFASTGAGGLSRLSVKLIKAGIAPDRIDPGKPEQNARHERLHLTLKQDTASPPAASLRRQQRRFDRFRRIYNEERPHAGLDNDTPDDRYQSSPRQWDGVLRDPAYDGAPEIRRVRPNGTIRWQGREVYITQALAGEPVALLEIDDDRWRARFGPVELGTIEPKAPGLKRPTAKARGVVDNPHGLPTTPRAQQPRQTP